jgi:hypothetical protein
MGKVLASRFGALVGRHERGHPYSGKGIDVRPLKVPFRSRSYQDEIKQPPTE